MRFWDIVRVTCFHFDLSTYFVVQLSTVTVIVVSNDILETAAPNSTKLAKDVLERSYTEFVPRIPYHAALEIFPSKIVKEF